jgi:uncharacterized protein YdiU (UPF0061 family)
VIQSHRIQNVSEHLFRKSQPALFPDASILMWNEPLAQQIGLRHLSTAEKLSFAAAQPLPSGADPIALAYAGHQFGHFVPILGDGRALMLGELQTNAGQRLDLQLKGIGQTPFSRRGDGRSALGPAIREYLVSEAMHGLGIPTTRSLSVVRTKQQVQRQTLEPGGILARVATSHIRIGTFEYLHARQDHKAMKRLMDDCIDVHYPEARDSENQPLAFFKAVSFALTRLVAQWMSVGFIHGVMNTDNMAISGETIDYGPCAFMDHFQADKTFSFIDQQGRYAYNQQPSILLWNLSVLAQSLAPLVDDQEQHAFERLGEVIQEAQAYFEQQWLHRFGRKLGILKADDQDMQLIQACLQWFHEEQLDFTQTFLMLHDHLPGQPPLRHSAAAADFYQRWEQSLSRHTLNIQQAQSTMRKVNPVCIARNHLIEQAIEQAYQGQDDLCHQLHKAWQTPYCIEGKNPEWLQPPNPDQVVLRTFCGT